MIIHFWFSNEYAGALTPALSHGERGKKYRPEGEGKTVPGNPSPRERGENSAGQSLFQRARVKTVSGNPLSLEGEG
ncbi:hypothetical protein BSPA111_17450 [Buttiauxella sp. A111]|nr:hypothetical protein BSPA111_17450 [Buttiauxella sp. A111]